jgi:signal transduction histidine kinase
MLCAPIFVRGSAFACFYTTHRGVTDLFNQEAERVARFLATLAGAALENAEGFAHIQALSRTLETRVEERTGQLAQANLELERRLRQLRETQDQLVLAGKMAAIGTLVAGLSHELNNPLNVILGYAQTLLERVPDHETAAAPLQSIVRNALRCRRLVRALLDFSRTGPSARAPTAPRTLAENAMELVSAEARGRDVTLALDVAPGELPTIRVVQQEIESALLNLLSNALHATPERGKVTLGACAREAAGIPGVEFTIHDTGCGIPNAVLSQIFDPFFTTKPVGQGTGLGLSLTRRIVESHDGHLTLETSEREGTEVRVWLPSDSASGPDETREGTTRDQAAGIYPDHR